jgi:hypothetical protein
MSSRAAPRTDPVHAHVPDPLGPGDLDHDDDAGRFLRTAPTTLGFLREAPKSTAAPSVLPAADIGRWQTLAFGG